MNIEINTIKQALAERFHTLSIDFHYFDTIDSTNRFFKTIPPIAPDRFACCIADEQTAGRGRFGKEWLSPPGVNIYCSLAFQIQQQSLTGLSLVTSLSILETLKAFVSPEMLQVKWPNDILYQQYKICGILIEQYLNQVIIGIGINVNGKLPPQTNLDKPWGSLFELTGLHFNRNLILTALLTHLTQDIKRLFTHGFNDFIPAWQKVDYLYNKKICMSFNESEIIGYARGITTQGQLIFEDLQGKIHHLTSGHASLLNFL